MQDFYNNVAIPHNLDFSPSIDGTNEDRIHNRDFQPYVQATDLPEQHQSQPLPQIQQPKTFTEQERRDYFEALDLTKNFPLDAYKDFDYLVEKYPAFKDKIQRARNIGISDDKIMDFLRTEVEPKINFLANRDQANAFLGRTPENMKRVADYEYARQLDILQQIYPDKTPEDIDNTIALSRFSGIDTVALLNNPVLSKAAAQEMKVSESYLESGIRGWETDRIDGEISNLFFEKMVIRGENFSPEDQKRYEALIKEAEKYNEPINTKFGQNAIAGASQVVHLMYEGTKAGIPYATTAAGMALLAGNAGAQALIPEETVTVPVAAGIGMAWGNMYNMFMRESGGAMREYMEMKDENGKPMDFNAARIAAILAGGVNAGIEFLQLSTIAKQFPGGDKLLANLDRKAIGALLKNPSVRSAWAKIGTGIGSRLKDITTETLQEITQETVTILGRELAKTTSGQPYPKTDWKADLGRIIEVAKQTIQSTAVLGTVSGLSHAVTNGIKYLTTQTTEQNQADYQTYLKETAEQVGISEEQLDKMIQESVQQTQTENQVLNNEEQQAEEITTPTENLEVQNVDVNEAALSEAENEQIQAKQSIETKQDEQNEQKKPEIVFIPREQFENLKAETPELAEIGGINADNEVGLTQEQFEQVKEKAPEFTASIANDVREGANGKTINEAIKKLQNTDPNKAEIFHSEENKKVMQHVTDDFIKAGETEEHAKTLGEIAGVISTVMQNTEGVPLTPITVKNVEDSVKQINRVLVKNPDTEMIIKNPNGEDFRIFTYHEENENENPEYKGYKDGDILIETEGKIVGIVDKQNLRHTPKRGDFNLSLAYEAIENFVQENYSDAEEEQSFNNFNPKEVTDNVGNTETQTYFKKDAQGDPISFTDWKFGRAFINLIKSGNFAANVHEIGHVTFDLMHNLANSGSIQMKDDFNTVLEHAGVTLEEWEADTKSKKGGAREKAHEYFSNAFEVYLSEGKAPTSKLQKVFERVKKFLLEIYDDIKTQLGIEIDDDMRGVFDRLFTLDDRENTTVSDFITRNNQIENQIDEYNAQLRAIEEERIANTSNEVEDIPIQNFEEIDPETMVSEEEPISRLENFDPEAQQNVDDWHGLRAWYEIQTEEYDVYIEGVEKLSKAIKDMGGIDYQSLAEYIGKDKAHDIYQKWSALFRGKQKLPIDEIANGLNWENFSEVREYGDSTSEGGGGSVNALVKYLEDTEPITGKYAPEKPLPPLPLYHVNANLVNSLLASDGVTGMAEYLDLRTEYLENEKENENSDKKAIEAELKEIKEFQQKFNPAWDEDDIKSTKRKKYKITKRDLKKAALTGYKVGIEEERATQNLKQQVKKAKWEEKTEEKINSLREARETDKIKYKERLENTRQKFKEQKADQQVKKAKWQQRAEEKFNAYREKRKAEREADKAKYKERLEAIYQKKKEQNENAVRREQEKYQKRIEKIQTRIDNLKAAQQARNEKADIKKTVKRIIKMSKAKNIRYYQLQEIQDLLNGFNLNRKEIKKRDAIRQFLDIDAMFPASENQTDLDKQLNEVKFTQEDIDDFLNKVHIEDMTLYDVKLLYDEVKSIFEHGRREYVLWKNERNQHRAELQQRMNEHIDALKEPKNRTITERKDLIKQFNLGRVGELGVMFWNETQNPGRFLEHGLGENFRVIFEDMPTEHRGDAQIHIDRRSEFVLGNMIKEGITYSDLTKDAIEIDGQNYTWEKVIAIYTGMKNEKSAKAILWGNFVNNFVAQNKLYNTEEEGMNAINKILNFINQDENKAYKKVGDLIIQDFENNYDRTNEAMIEHFNKGMNKEEFYTPIVRLQHQSPQGVIINEETEQIGAEGDSNALLNKVQNGFTISRENISEQRQPPIDLHIFKNWFRAVRDQEYMIALGGYASDVASALLSKNENGKSVAEQIKSKLGMPYWKTLTSIFNDSITDRTVLEENALEGFLGFLVKARSVAYIAWNPVSWLTQTSSYFLALPYAGPKHLFRSLSDAVTMANQGRWEEFLERVYQKSPELRVTGGDPVINSMRQNASSSYYGKFIDLGFGGVTALDNWTKAIVFDAVYQSKLEEGYSDKDAVRLANRAVHDTQPASTNRETARIFRNGNKSTRLFFLQFMNALAPLYNMAVVDVARNLASPSWNNVKSTAIKLLAVSISFYYSQLIKDFINGRLPSHRELPNGEDDDWGKWSWETFIDNLIGCVPVFNNFSDIIQRWRGKRQMKSDNPLVEPFSHLYNAGNYAFNEKYDGERNGKAIEELVHGLALVGIPIPYSGIKNWGKILGLWD